MPKEYMIVGVGNPLRGDDGAGWELARQLQVALRSHGAPVQIRFVQQLLPELAAEIADIAPDVLVVADCTIEPGTASLQRLGAVGTEVQHSHGLTPALMYTIAVRLYEFTGTAWLATVLGTEFGHDEALSCTTRQAIVATVPRVIAELLAWAK